jgi:hypothetical protein
MTTAADRHASEDTGHSGTLAQASVSDSDSLLGSDGWASPRRITDEMLRTLAIASGVLCAGVLAGCGGSHPVPDAAHGYLYRYGNGESFLQLHRHGQKVHGTIDETTIACCAPIPARLIREALTVNGTISGSNVLLRLSNGVTWTGTLSHSSVSIRSSNNAPLAIRYRLANGADYNAAVAQTKAAFQRQKNG